MSLRCRVGNIINTTFKTSLIRPLNYDSRLKIRGNLGVHLQLNPFVNIQVNSKFYHDPLPTGINEILQALQNQKKLNEKTILLEHLTDVLGENPALYLTRDQTAIIVRQLKLWEGGKGRFDKVATVAWVITRLNLTKELKGLYNQITQRFENDEWYVNFDESLKALEAFSYLENQTVKDYIYPRIERNLSITVWEENMKTYQRMVVGLLESGRMQSPLWDKLEDLILRNLGMQYSLKSITDIFMCYALAGKGSDKFFQMLQKVIYLGHWYDYEVKHKILPGYDQTGEFYAMLVETYSIVKTNCDIYLMPDFLDYIYQGVADRRTNYQHLGSFTKLILHLPVLFEEEDQEQILVNLLQNKKPNSITYPQIIQFYHTLKQKDIKLSKNLQNHIERILFSDIRKKLIPPSKVIEICDQLLDNNYVLNKADLLESVQIALTSGFKYLEGEEAKAVLELSKTSKFLPSGTKKLLSLPGKVDQ